jgi:isopentenyldiphosphate isomerase
VRREDSRGEAPATQIVEPPRAIENLILVNGQNQAVGRAEKRLVHQAGLLHRAFPISLVDDAGKLLLQQRSPAKYQNRLAPE